MRTPAIDRPQRSQQRHEQGDDRLLNHRRLETPERPDQAGMASSCSIAALADCAASAASGTASSSASKP